MRKVSIKAVVLVMAAGLCLTGCPSPNSGGGDDNNLAPAVREAADAFTTAHIAVLDKTVRDITTADEEAVDAALAAYEALGETEKSLLSGEKTLLDSLKGRINALKETDAFKTVHAAVLSKTANAVTAADEAAINAALVAYEVLGKTEKTLLSGEKTLLNSLKAVIDALKADAFKTTHAAVLDKTTGTVTVEDEEAVEAALAAYEALGEAEKALLSAEKALLDKLKAKIPQLKVPGRGGFTFTVWAHDDEDLFSDIPENFNISKDNGDILTVKAAEDLDSIQWSLNGKDILAPRGTAREITIAAASYIPGSYTLGFYATKEGIPYSKNFTIIVEY